MSNQPLKIAYTKNSDLIPYARNSRTHNDAQVAQIAASIREFGFTNPILTDESGGIIAGHGRVMAARKLGMAEVPTITLSGMTETQKRAYVIADNKLALNAGCDEEALQNEMQALSDASFDLSLTGFDAAELSALLDKAISTDGLTDEDAVPETPEQPVTRPGDVWLLGKHRLMCGDSTSVDAVEKLMAGERADLLHTDPPYGVSYQGGRKKWEMIKNDAETGEDLFNFLTEAFSCAQVACAEDAPWYVWHASNTTAEFYDALKASGKKPSDQIIWVKNIMAGGFADYRGKHEPSIYCGGGRARWHAGRDQDTVWNVSRENNYKHPTQKPVELVERAINHSSKIGQIVLDLFGGSGSTMLACEKTKRHARLMELDPKYCDVIVKRWQDFTGKKATHAETGKTFEELSNGRN